ncbi:ribose operon repressor [Bifidobacterium gallicum DSM 20093 = LMG 11596]|uniref:Ribose operon repressor n=1 Tax=Bifidobacterium gallicum DSM 20093 = LMG 11596 TaxID=561180 RepID=A0A087AJN6_9BIFI|nr:LacI family DNA-binding transcriptional regulator [Bifidobacterium gallicum]KFI58986.1 ribose operon repressor [Bifidobacterium gallicum DSM 20093 = LMG 11596]
MRRVTLKDVAAMAGVAVATASLVLNGRQARVADATRERILQAAADLNYVPNQNARSLVTKRSMLIALIVPDIENLFFASLCKCLEDQCAASGYSLIMANSDDSRATERALIDKLTSRGVDGIMIIASRESYEDADEFRRQVENIDCPVILLDRLFDGDWCDGVGVDNLRGGALAAQCLANAGHTRIACVTGGSDSRNADARVWGFLGALEALGQPVAPEYIVDGGYRFEGGQRAAQQLLRTDATAVFCCNDIMASGFIQQCVRDGVRVPEDVSVMGYDDVLQRYGMRHDLTTVMQDVEELAKQGWMRLHKQINAIDRRIAHERAGKTETRSAAARDAQHGLADSTSGAGKSSQTEASQTALGGRQAAEPAVGTNHMHALGAGKSWLTHARTLLLEPTLAMRETVAPPRS